MDRVAITYWCKFGQFYTCARTRSIFQLFYWFSPPNLFFGVKSEQAAFLNGEMGKMAFWSCCFIFVSSCQIFNWEMCLPLTVRWFAFQLNVDSLLFISWPLIDHLIGKTNFGCDFRRPYGNLRAELLWTDSGYRCQGGLKAVEGSRFHQLSCLHRSWNFKN